MDWLLRYIIYIYVWIFGQVLDDFRGHTSTVYDSFLILFKSLVKYEGKGNATEDTEKDKNSIHT